MTLRIDLISIFPDYFSPLELSLIGKARQQGLLEIGVHDLRGFATDRHRTVDDTPYGGGAGMVMMAEPWGEAIDSVRGESSVLIVPTPAGRLFQQDLAGELSTLPHLIIACGRYEGIDQRVVDYYRGVMDVHELSIGDYVLGGGEVAALVMVEAITRLVPGVLGNPESLVEESHELPGVEYPSYTRPPVWRGLDVPDVLLSGHHEEVKKWRQQASVLRTATNRPDLSGEPEL